MDDIPNTLFSETQKKELSKDEKISTKQRRAVQRWKDNLDANVLDIESQHKEDLRDLMIEALGYSRDKIKSEWGEMNTRLDYSYIPPSGSGGVLFELKSRSKKPFKPQGYSKKEQHRPVDQAITYIEKNPNIAYAVVTNFEEFVLITRDDLKSQCYKFVFPPKGMKLLDSEIKEFVHFFSKNGIESGFIERAKRETIVEESEITAGFYKLYHQTRLMLVHSFENRIGYDNAIKITQTYLNRLIFLFFAEDNGLIRRRTFTEGILSRLDSGSIREKTTQISDHIQTLFSWMDSGSDEIDNKLGFNGEFFSELIDRNAFFYDFESQKFFQEITKQVQVPNRIKLNKVDQTAIDRYDGRINPIIINLLKMASYNFQDNLSNELEDAAADDFDERVSVNILGHIFEQSIGDLEELQKKETSQRKTEGIFYTPEYVTRYICKNTILSYLTKDGSTEPHQLVAEYKDNMHELEKQLQEIKILDPACGSGAFLVKAVDILISIYDEIQNFKQEKGAYTISKKSKRELGMAKQMTFDKEHEAENARGIIQNNIYGVDINPESVEITKLSLFLKIATKNKRLLGLSQRIKVGNSIIDDDAIDKRFFNWETEFAEILDPQYGKKFDIVVGNPPYVRQETIKDYASYLKKSYQSYSGKADLYVYFVEKAANLLKHNGVLGMITSGKFTEASYGKPLQKFMADNLTFKKIINFGDLEVFKDISAYPLIFLTSKNSNQNYDFSYYKISELDFKDLEQKLSSLQPLDVNMTDLIENNFNFLSKESIKIIKKISNNSISLKKYCGLPLVGVKTGFNDGYVTEQKISDFVKPYIFGKNIKKYDVVESENNIIFPYEFKHSSYALIDIKKHTTLISQLEKNRPKLQKRAVIKDGLKNGTKKWYEYQQINKTLNFAKEFIVYPNVSLGNNFTLSSGNVIDMTGFIIPSNERIVLGILNSQLTEFLLKQWAIVRRGGYQEYKVQYLERIPIPEIPQKEKQSIEDVVEEILVISRDRKNIYAKLMNNIKVLFNPKKLTRKLENIHELSYLDFMKEIKKVSQQTISWDEQDSLQEDFEKRITMINAHTESINKLEEKINVLVFKLYNLNKNEIFHIVKFLDTN